MTPGSAFVVPAAEQLPTLLFAGLAVSVAALPVAGVLTAVAWLLALDIARVLFGTGHLDDDMQALINDLSGKDVLLTSFFLAPHLQTLTAICMQELHCPL